MKTINLPALSQVTFEDVCIFLTWLDSNLNGEVSLNHLERNSPLRTSKLKPMVKVLEQFEFTNKKENRIKITFSGQGFSKSQLLIKRSVLRVLFLKVEVVQKVMELLKLSSTGRLQKRVLVDVFSLGSLFPIPESETQAFIAWGQYAHLFDYDKKKEDILPIGTLLPIDPDKPGTTGNTTQSQ